jgi:hypothetical protein
MRRELASRANDGIEVSLLWNSADDRLVVRVVDRLADTAFEVRARADNALDVFHHPFAYAAESVAFAAAVPS